MLCHGCVHGLYVHGSVCRAHLEQWLQAQFLRAPAVAAIPIERHEGLRAYVAAPKPWKQAENRPIELDPTTWRRR